MNVHEAIARAEALLPGIAAPDGEIDPRWQAVIAVGDFIETDPEAIWPFIDRWGRSENKDVRTAIATCLLEHLLEHHFDRVIGRVEDAARADRLFASTVRMCWKFGRAEEPARVARVERLNVFLDRD